MTYKPKIIRIYHPLFRQYVWIVKPDSKVLASQESVTNVEKALGWCARTNADNFLKGIGK